MWVILTKIVCSKFVVTKFVRKLEKVNLCAAEKNIGILLTL